MMLEGLVIYLFFTRFYGFDLYLRFVLPFETAGVGLGNPTLDVMPFAIPRHLSSHASKDVLLCERVQVAGLSRLKLGSYASSFRVTVAPSVVIPERLHSKILVCFHR